jgi:hypothetical protein
MSGMDGWMEFYFCFWHLLRFPVFVFAPDSALARKKSTEMEEEMGDSQNTL